jgi:hypothetical protein
LLNAGWQAQAQDTKAPYPSAAPLDQYLMERNAEVAMARSAAPESISRDAEVVVLGRHGYETAVKGKKRFRMHGGTIMDRRDRRSRFLESQGAGSDLLQPASRAIQRPTHDQKDRVGIGRPVQS